MTSFSSDFIDSENRRRERTQLLTSLKNSINTFVFGSQGIGKTTTLRIVVEEYNKNFGDAIYIDCTLYQTTNAILKEILLSLGSVVASKSNYDLIKRLKKKAEKMKLVVILDHCANLRTHEIIKLLLGLNLPFCLVSTSFDIYKKMSLALRSRITNLMRMSEFAEEEILDLLRERKTSINEDLLHKIVQKSGGNISFAVNVLDTITTYKNSSKAIDLITLLKELDNETLSGDKEILLKILKQSKRLPSGELYRLYCRKLEHPKSERSFRKYMQALCKQGLVKSIGEKKGRVYKIDQVENKRIQNGRSNS